MADDDARGGPGPTGEGSPEAAPSRAVPWELAELGAVIALVVIGVLAVAALASGIVGSTVGGRSSVADWQLLFETTNWANFACGLLLVAGAALVWHEAREWEGPEGAGRAAKDPASVHRRRIQGLAWWTAAAVFVVAIASVGPFTALLLQPQQLGAGQPWFEYVLDGGSAVATLVLCAFALYLAVLARVELTPFRSEPGREASPTE